MAKTALEKIKELEDSKASALAALEAERDKEIAALKDSAVAELKEKLKAAQSVVRGIEDALADLTGKAVTRSKKGVSSGRSVTAVELSDAIPAKTEVPARAVAKTLGTVAKEVLATAKANPDRFKIVANGPQPKIKRL